MSDRRSLIEGLKPEFTKVDPNLEKAFVFGDTETKSSEPVTNGTNASGHVSRSPVSTRVRSDLATALKRASLERQLNNQTPSSLQDILETALEDWLRNNKHL